jgi:hypothetical protein
MNGLQMVQISGLCDMNLLDCSPVEEQYMMLIHEYTRNESEHGVKGSCKDQLQQVSEHSDSDP